MSDVAALTEDGFLRGRLRLKQPRRGHRAGHDAILLAACTPAVPGERIVDLGAGIGAAGLAIASRCAGVDLVLVERDQSLVKIARENISFNELAACAVVLDVTRDARAFTAAGLPPASADRVLMNPPFNEASRHRPSPDPARRLAHEDSGETLDAWLRTARRILKPGGTVTLIWRAEGIERALAALARGFGGVIVLPVHPQPDAAAIRILIRATKGSRAPMALL